MLADSPRLALESETNIFPAMFSIKMSLRRSFGRRAPGSGAGAVAGVAVRLGRSERGRGGSPGGKGGRLRSASSDYLNPPPAIVTSGTIAL